LAEVDIHSQQLEEKHGKLKHSWGMETWRGNCCHGNQ